MLTSCSVDLLRQHLMDSLSNNITRRSFLRSSNSSNSQLVVKQILPQPPTLQSPIDLFSIREFCDGLESYEALLPDTYKANPAHLLSTEQLKEIATINFIAIPSLKEMRAWTGTQLRKILLQSLPAVDAADLLKRYKQITPIGIGRISLVSYMKYTNDWNWCTWQGGDIVVDFMQLKCAFINGLGDMDLQLKVTASSIMNIEQLFSVTLNFVRRLVQSDRERTTLDPSSSLLSSSLLTAALITNKNVTCFRASQVTASSSARNNIMSDSCASHIFLNALTHFDSPPTFLHTPLSVKVANGAEEPIMAVGQYRRMPAYYVPTLVCSLVSISVLTDHRYIVVFNKDMMTAYLPVDVDAHNVLDRLFCKSTCSTESIFALKNAGLYTISSSSDSIVPPSSSSVLSPTASPFNPQLSAAMTYYRDGSPTNLELRELVRYWHEALGHPTMEKMVDVVKYQTYQNLPSRLTTAVIRKYFPTCQACARGNLHRSALPLQSNATREWLSTHRERRFEIDIKGPYTDSSGKPCLTYSGSSLTLNAVDTATGMEFTWLLQHKRHLVYYVKKLELPCIRYGYCLSVSVLTTIF